jgi:hypothetical protein
MRPGCLADDFLTAEQKTENLSHKANQHNMLRHFCTIEQP